MKRLSTLLVICLLINLPNLNAQKNNGAATAAVVGGLLAIGTGIAAVESMKEQAELSATEWFLTNHPEFSQFSMKTLDFDGKKMGDLSRTSLLTFRVVDFEIDGSSKDISQGEGLKIKNKFVLFCFTSSGWINEYGINKNKIKWKLVNVNDWIDMMVAYSKVASGSNDDERIRELIKRGKIVNKGIKVKNARDLNFYKMGGDMYLVDDYSDDMKLIFNERSLGIYLKETKDLVQISRGAIIKIHDFFMNEPKSL